MKRQQSSIDRLPDDIKSALQELLRDPRCTQLEAVEKINEIIREQGNDVGAIHVGANNYSPLPMDVAPLSKSAVNRYAVRMEQVGAKLRQSREVAAMWIGKLGTEPQGEVGKLLNEMVRNLAFDTVVKMSEEDEMVEPRMIKDLAFAIQKLEQATSDNVKRDGELKKQLASAAEKAVDDAVSGTPGAKMTAEQFKQIIRETYGA